MNRNLYLFLVIFSFITTENSQAQKGNSKLGAWYSYFVNSDFKDSEFGIMGDVQYRNYEVTSDFQQFIVRAGLSYSFKNTPLKVLAGYSYFITGLTGESEETFEEHRPYQDVIWNQKIASRLYFLHRIRIEERFIENQDFRMRYRYMLNAKIPLNKPEISAKTLYLWTAGEVFLNGKQSAATPNIYDRTWFFGGGGYKFSNAVWAELAYMREITNAQTKGQLIVSLFHKF
ncbi:MULTISPECIES: DUF2490 domain-containing protein [unclassified Leeuwenhoekiella]|uniref:DUF2490 domain-containing protein n=1 Tax=unclassified Leeuwenhoekiella TaxID=2615029 RepID=UPI0025BA3EA0|nr:MULTISPECIES: DUF2490 domain-containing protein [unclassified Leeuwenhoekiella]